MLTKPHQAYQQTAIQTATPMQIIIMLYDGALRFIRIATDSIEKRKYDQANYNFIRAQAIIQELRAVLDHKYPIAKNLERCYEYMLYRLIQANMRKDVSMAKEVMEHLETLKEAWKEVSKSAAAGVQELK